ncbi:TPA: hypothetical protein DEP94_02495 [Candidatus Nomurabacteria bacterium]|nr:hypothetical protein [Candidatus Nomurabacteria bacterium]
MKTKNRCFKHSGFFIIFITFVRIAIRKLDTFNILILILFETKSLDTKKYISLSEKTNEIGKMLGGWNGQLTKQQAEKKN